MDFLCPIWYPLFDEKTLKKKTKLNHLLKHLQTSFSWQGFIDLYLSLSQDSHLLNYMSCLCLIRPFTDSLSSGCVVLSSSLPIQTYCNVESHSPAELLLSPRSSPLSYYFCIWGRRIKRSLSPSLSLSCDDQRSWGPAPLGKWVTVLTKQGKSGRTSEGVWEINCVPRKTWTSSHGMVREREKIKGLQLCGRFVLKPWRGFWKNERERNKKEPKWKQVTVTALSFM